MKRDGWKCALEISTISLLLILGMVSSGLAFNPEPPPEGSQLRGPAVLGKVTLDGVSIAFSDIVCKGKKQSAPEPVWYDYNLADVTSAQAIVGFYVDGAANIMLPGCYDFDGGLIVEAAYNLQEIQTTSGPIIQIDVVVLGVVAR